VVVTPVTEPVPRFHAVPARASMRAGEQAMLAALPEVMTLLGAAGPTVDDR